MPAPSAAPFDRPLLFVGGKGGVGKSTVAVLLALHHAGRGRRVLLARIGSTRVPTPPGIAELSVEGRAALDEYLGLQLPAVVARRLVKLRLYRRLANGAPGLADLMALGKLADEARSGRWDTVVADAGSTGHLVQMLGMPGALARAFGRGLVRGEVLRLASELGDARHTALVAVTIAEELAIDELRDLCASCSALGVTLASVIVNRMHVAPFAPSELVAPPGAPAFAVEAVRRGRVEALAAARDRHELGRLGPLARDALLLPDIATEEIGASELEALAASIGSQLGARTVTA